MPEPPEAFYRQRLTALEGAHRMVQSRNTFFLLALTASVLLFLAMLFGALRHLLLAWPLALPACAAIGLGFAFFKARRALDRLTRLIAHYEAAIDRVTHRPAQNPQTGEAFRDPGHLYYRDLNILGPDSLFALLATTRTGWGQRALAETLLVAPAPAETLERQHAIRELTPSLELREAITLLGSNAFQSTSPETFESWLDEDQAGFPSFLRPILYLTSSAAMLLGLAWGAGRLPLDSFLQNLAAVFGLQAAIALRYRAKTTAILETTAPLPGQIQILRDGLQLLRRQRFTSPHLQGLQARSTDADKALVELQRHLFLVEQRKTEWFYLPALAVNAGTHAAIRIDRWKRIYAVGLRDWIAAFAHLEALSALATYAFEHPENTFPELLPPDHQATFEATSLAHPLLPNAVANGISLHASTRFYLISGSNMAGKSTLLRAIGLATVLARAGCPIPAGHARLTPLALGASLALTDSLAEGKSKFLAEVERLQQILALARHAPTLFLIDELFSGTNSSDRLAAAEAVLDALLVTGAIGALSTHDLALTTLATPARHGENVHMTSPHPDDPLAFDYLLKPGINTTTNALAFLRLLKLDTRP